jgi:formamidopyrimidine-DNA glycosylase
MPELPEVETVRRGLHGLIVGRVFKAVDHDNPKSFPNVPDDIKQFLIGSKVVDVRRRAKVLMIDLSSGCTLVIHLKMTGQLVFIDRKLVGSKSNIANEVRFAGGHPSDSLVGSLPDKSTRVVFYFKDETHLYFNDQRKFGWIRIIPTDEVENLDFMKKVGPEPLEDNFTSKEFTECFMRRSKTSIKAALLDQSVIAGVGNIYADESLWAAKIHPSTLVGNLSSVKLKLLYEAVRLIMNLAIEKGGSTDRNYVDAEGKKGSYLSFAKVFRREGQPCLSCGTEIIKLRVAGRGTHICPVCQIL